MAETTQTKQSEEKQESRDFGERLQEISSSIASNMESIVQENDVKIVQMEETIDQQA